MNAGSEHTRRLVIDGIRRDLDAATSHAPVPVTASFEENTTPTAITVVITLTFPRATADHGDA